LQNAVERAVVLSDGDQLDAEQFAFLQQDGLHTRGDGLMPGMTVDEAERKLILKTLESCQDNRTRAAELLGISVRTLRNKLKEYREAGHYGGGDDDL